MSKEIKLNDVTIKNSVRVMMEDTSFNQFRKIAEELNMKPTTFQSSLDNDTLRVRDLKKVADLLGYEVILKGK
jgi:hypothetical protein